MASVYGPVRKEYEFITSTEVLDDHALESFVPWSTASTSRHPQRGVIATKAVPLHTLTCEPTASFVADQKPEWDGLQAFEAPTP
jgi:hypothetical protein